MIMRFALFEYFSLGRRMKFIALNGTDVRSGRMENERHICALSTDTIIAEVRPHLNGFGSRRMLRA